MVLSKNPLIMSHFFLRQCVFTAKSNIVLFLRVKGEQNSACRSRVCLPVIKAHCINNIPASDGTALADWEARKCCTWEGASHCSGSHAEYRKRPWRQCDDTEACDNTTSQYSEYSDFERYIGVRFLFGETT